MLQAVGCISYAIYTCRQYALSVDGSVNVGGAGVAIAVVAVGLIVGALVELWFFLVVLGCYRYLRGKAASKICKLNTDNE